VLSTAMLVEFWLFMIASVTAARTGLLQPDIAPSQWRPGRFVGQLFVSDFSDQAGSQEGGVFLARRIGNRRFDSDERLKSEIELPSL